MRSDKKMSLGKKERQKDICTGENFRDAIDEMTMTMPG
jgi:hypothetical protein